MQVIELQSRFARQNSPFWEGKRVDLSEEECASYLISKKDLRGVDPFVFVPCFEAERLRFCFGTSGTTGEPTFSFWTSEDWNFKIRTLVKALNSRSEIPSRIVALNCYSLNHLAGQIFTDTIAALGGISIPSGYFRDDCKSLVKMYRELNCNTLIMGEAENSHKYSIGSRKLFSYLTSEGLEINLSWWLSSGPVAEDTISLAHQLQIGTLNTFYGCSEFGFLAMGCRIDPIAFHVLGGDSLLERGTQSCVDSRRYEIIASRIGEFQGKGDARYEPHKGSQFLRYLSGDEGTWVDLECRCGIRGPLISGIRRKTVC